MTATQPLKKYMSSKEIYFLPLLHKLDPHTLRTTYKPAAPPAALTRSIEQIMKDKQTPSPPKEHSNSLGLPPPRTKTTTNLYNKYEFLPQIYYKKYRKDQVKSTCLEYSNPTTNSDACPPISGQSQDSHNKENSVNFDSTLYKNRFNQKLQREVSKIQFKINHELSHNNLIMASTIEEQSPSEEGSESKKRKYKYTRLRLSSAEKPEKRQLEKVPSFLLKVLETNKSSFLTQQ